MPTIYGPRCAACKHPIRMMVAGRWRDIPCNCPDTPGTPPHRHTGPGPAPWDQPDGQNYHPVRKPPIGRMIRERMAAAAAKRRQGG